MDKSARMNNDAISVQGLSVSLGGRPILSDLSFTLRRGEVLACLGRSGSGKTTLLRALAALIDWTSGSGSIFGIPFAVDGAIINSADVRRHSQFVFQTLNLFPNMTIERNLTLGLERVAKIESGKARAIAENAAADLGITHILKRYPDEISGGEAQRAAIARAIVLEPSVLLLDEITASLDPTSASLVTLALRGLREKRGDDLTIVMATHMARFANQFADRLFFLDDSMVRDDLRGGDLFSGTFSPALTSYLRDLEAAS